MAQDPVTVLLHTHYAFHTIRIYVIMRVYVCAYYKMYLPRVQLCVWQFQLRHILSWPHTSHNIERGNLEQKSSWDLVEFPVPIIAPADLVVNTNKTRTSSSNLVHNNEDLVPFLNPIITRRSSCVNTNKTRRSSWLFMSWFAEIFALWVDRSLVRWYARLVHKNLKV